MTTSKIKFGKFESVSGYWDDDKQADVFIDGVEVGYVVQDRRKPYLLSDQILTYSYDFHALADGFEDVSVDVRTSRRVIQTASAAKRELKALILDQFAV